MRLGRGARLAARHAFPARDGASRRATSSSAFRELDAANASRLLETEPARRRPDAGRVRPGLDGTRKALLRAFRSASKASNTSPPRAAEGRGVLLTGAHFSHLELAGRLLSSKAASASPACTASTATPRSNGRSGARASAMPTPCSPKNEVRASGPLHARRRRDLVRTGPGHARQGHRVRALLRHPGGDPDRDPSSGPALGRRRDSVLPSTPRQTAATRCASKRRWPIFRAPMSPPTPPGSMPASNAWRARHRPSTFGCTDASRTRRPERQVYGLSLIVRHRQGSVQHGTGLGNRRAFLDRRRARWRSSIGGSSACAGRSAFFAGAAIGYLLARVGALGTTPARHRIASSSANDGLARHARCDPRAGRRADPPRARPSTSRPPAPATQPISACRRSLRLPERDAPRRQCRVNVGRGRTPEPTAAPVCLAGHASRRDPDSANVSSAGSRPGSPKATCRSRSACSCCSPASPPCSSTRPTKAGSRFRSSSALIGVAIAAMAALVFAWRQRDTPPRVFAEPAGRRDRHPAADRVRRVPPLSPAAGTAGVRADDRPRRRGLPARGAAGCAGPGRARHPRRLRRADPDLDRQRQSRRPVFLLRRAQCRDLRDRLVSAPGAC